MEEPEADAQKRTGSERSEVAFIHRRAEASTQQDRCRFMVPAPPSSSPSRPPSSSSDPSDRPALTNSPSAAARVPCSAASSASRSVVAIVSRRSLATHRSYRWCSVVAVAAVLRSAQHSVVAPVVIVGDSSAYRCSAVCTALRRARATAEASSGSPWMAVLSRRGTLPSSDTRSSSNSSHGSSSSSTAVSSSSGSGSARLTPTFPPCGASSRSHAASFSAQPSAAFQDKPNPHDDPRPSRTRATASATAVSVSLAVVGSAPSSRLEMKPYVTSSCASSK
mmetsp:Transcript_6149/g.13572  ORF Transcript_6149/g.13572 Transcript_6149/m.13572 type:complete len:279 (-) Transcript_6149:899-1735(-)